MSDFQVTTVTVSGLKDNVVLPKFQRGYVWNKTKKVELIDSLHNGFPFGALLTYQKSVDEKEKLLDGQQRWTTILDFQKNKGEYYKKLEPAIYAKALTNLNSWIIEGDHITDSDFDDVVSSRADLSDWVDTKITDRDFGEKLPKDIRDLIKSLQNKINDYLKVEDLQIPIIRYTGDEKNIAQVFENLNKGGVQLTKFEIFASAWSHNTLKLDNTILQNKVLDYVKTFYIEKQENAEEYGFSLDGFSEDELTSNRVINLFELGIGIGAFVQEKLPSLVTNNEKHIKEMGFGILGVATGIDPKSLGEIPSKINVIIDNLENIMLKTSRICNKLSSIFDKMIKQNTNKDNDKMDYHRSLTTTFKTLSYFATLWELEDNSDEERTVLKNIPAYYVRDAIDGVWGNAGDTRLFEYYANKNERDYLESPIKDEFLNKFKLWIREENKQTERFSGEVKALTTIHANLTYLSSTIDFGEPFQFEHIFPKGRVRELDTGRNVFLGRLGNAMYLPKELNQNKKTKLLYEIEERNKYKRLIAESSYPSEKDFDNSFLRMKDSDFSVINKVIEERSYRVAEDIIEKLINNGFVCE